VEERVEDLEGRLFGKDDAEEVDEEDDEDYMEEGEEGEEEAVSGLSRLRVHSVLYLQIQQMIDHIGEHPFLVTLRERLREVRKTLLLDLGAALRQAKQLGKFGDGSLIKIVGLYRELGQASEAIKILKAG